MKKNLEFNDVPQSFFNADVPDTPYSRAREEWDNRIGRQTVQAANWRYACFGVIALCFLLICGLLYQSTKAAVVPYIVQVDNQGAVINVARADERHAPNENEIKYFITEIIRKTRTVPKDPVQYTQNWNEVYAYFTQEAANKMNDLIQKEGQAEKLQKGYTVMPEIKFLGTVTNQENTYQIRWVETVYKPDGKQEDKYNMAAFFTITFGQPRDEKGIFINPLGLYIKDLSWDKEH